MSESLLDRLAGFGGGADLSGNSARYRFQTGNCHSRTLAKAAHRVAVPRPLRGRPATGRDKGSWARFGTAQPSGHRAPRPGARQDRREARKWWRAAALVRTIRSASAWSFRARHNCCRWRDPDLTHGCRSGPRSRVALPSPARRHPVKVPQMNLGLLQHMIVRISLLADLGNRR